MTNRLHHFGSFWLRKIDARQRTAFARWCGLDFSISYTTRAPRGSEQNGREYFFVSRADFEAMIREDEFLEYADVYGNYYGTARRFLREAKHDGHDLLLDIDVQGAAQIKAKIPAGCQHFCASARIGRHWSGGSAIAAPIPSR